MIRNPQSLEDKYAQLAFDTAFSCKENNSNCQTPASDGGAADVKQFIGAAADRKMRPTTLSSVSPSELSQNTLCRPSDPMIAP